MHSDELRRLSRLTRQIQKKFNLDLSGLVVLTEAATGAFSATAPLAALAGAKVIAVAKKNHFGSSATVVRQTKLVAKSLGVSKNMTFVRSALAAPLSTVDIVTNSGNVRPIERKLLCRLKANAVLSLMVEPWEVRPADVDLPYAKKAGIACAGTNEHGTRVNIFQYLEPLIDQIARRNRISLHGRRVLLLTTPQFRPYFLQAVRKFNATCTKNPRKAEAVLIATGHEKPVPAKWLQAVPPGTPAIQLWGDVAGGRSRHLRWYPRRAPRRGHMGYLLSDLGPEPTLCLIAGGLKVGEILARGRTAGLSPAASVRRAVRSGFAMTCG